MIVSSLVEIGPVVLRGEVEDVKVYTERRMNNRQ
jgi:hypothetical protein